MFFSGVSKTHLRMGLDNPQEFLEHVIQSGREDDFSQLNR